MKDNRTLSVCIPTWNRYELTKELVESIVDYPFITEIVVCDDASTDGSYEKLRDFSFYHPKVKLYKNEKNIDCYFNKRQAAFHATNEYICLIDSDNKFPKEYFDAIFAQKWKEDVILAPNFLKPAFDFRMWSDLTLTKENIAQYANTSVVDTGCNAMNFFINRTKYLEIWDGSINPGTFDSLYFSYCWLKAGNKIHITPNMQYEHKLHEDKSNHFSTHQHKYTGFFTELMNKIKQLR